MFVAVAVHYGDAAVVAAAVVFERWTDELAVGESSVFHPPNPAPYTPGAFYERELPYLVPLIERLVSAPEVVVIDGYVWLGLDRAGLGKHLHDRIGLPVIGVAKTSFAGATATEVLRGESAQPLYVTAIGIDEAEAAAHIREMHGPYRIPTLLKRADSLARGLRD